MVVHSAKSEEVKFKVAVLSSVDSLIVIDLIETFTPLAFVIKKNCSLLSGLCILIEPS